MAAVFREYRTTVYATGDVTERVFLDWLGPVPSPQTLSRSDGTELRLDGDVPVSVNISD